MEYSDDYLRRWLPPEDPPEELVPADVQREIARVMERGDFGDRELLVRSIRWTYAIFFELGLGNYRWTERRYPFAPHEWLFPRSPFEAASVGLYDPKVEEGGFGLCVDSPMWDGPPFYVIGYIRFTRLKHDFPVAIRSTSIELHSAPNPNGATTTCWARCNTSNIWGIVTAGHAIATSLPGIAVPMDDGSTGISHRSFWQPIDAAFVATPAPEFVPATLPVHNFPAAGIPVVVECQSGAQQRTVAAACNSLGFYRTRSWPVLYFLDNPCVPGDSGALVRLMTGEAGGIYLGAEPCPGTGGTSGRVLNFAQAMFALDTTPYR